MDVTALNRDGGAPATAPPDANMYRFLDDLPFADDEVVATLGTDGLTAGDLQARVAEIARCLRSAGVRPGRPVGNLVERGVSSIPVMFAVWALDAVYVPINRRYTQAELVQFATETPFAALVGSAADLDRFDVPTTTLALDHAARTIAVRQARPDVIGAPYDADVALVLRTSGTTGRPKAVLLRHSGTTAALDASLQKLRNSRRSGSDRPTRRMNLVPVSLALWAGIFNTLFSFRAGSGVVLLDPFTPDGFAEVVRTHHVTSTVLPPAMITMLTNSELTSLEPLRSVRSITAPLSPVVARRFHQRFGVVVLNSYGQTELGGEVVGWSSADIREFGESKLGAVGRPYDHIELRVRDDSGAEQPVGEIGEIQIRSPFRMRGYANGAEDDDRFVDGYLRTGDLGRLDDDGFLWIEGRVSDMINRGGLKVFPDDVENALRQHDAVLDAGVAGVPDERLGEVPVAWVVMAGGAATDDLPEWCRGLLAPYKVPVAFRVVDTLPRNDVGKLLRGELQQSYSA